MSIVIAQERVKNWNLNLAIWQFRSYNRNMRLGDWVREERERQGLTGKDLAEKAKVSASAVTRLEKGERLGRADTIARIAGALGLDDNRVRRMLAEEEIAPPRRRTPQEILRELEASTPILVPETQQPSSAGGGVIQAEAEYWPYFPGPGERDHEYIAVPVVGTCMEPKIPEGARVIVDKSASPRPGDIVLALHDGELIVKTLEQRNGDLLLVALQGRPPIKIDERTQIVGVVRYWGMRP